MNKKGYDLVARRHRWLTRFVYQMNGHDAVGAPHILSNERRYVGVGSAIGQLPSDEAIALLRRPQSAPPCKTYHL